MGFRGVIAVVLSRYIPGNRYPSSDIQLNMGGRCMGCKGSATAWVAQKGVINQRTQVEMHEDVAPILAPIQKN